MTAQGLRTWQYWERRRELGNNERDAGDCAPRCSGGQSKDRGNGRFSLEETYDRAQSS